MSKFNNLLKGYVVEYPCIGVALTLAAEGRKTLYIPHVWISWNEGIYGDKSFYTYDEAIEQAQLMINELKEKAK